MHITPTYLSRTSHPHSDDEIFTHLRVFRPHPEEGLILKMYESALQWVESRTRRFLGTTELTYTFDSWCDILRTSWYLIPVDGTISMTYIDTDEAEQTYTDITFVKQKFTLGDEPTDREPGSTITLEITSRPYLREDLSSAVLLLTAQWYENRGDQNIRGTPHWINSICGLHSYQTV